MSHSDQVGVNTPLGSFISQITSPDQRETRGQGWSQAGKFGDNISNQSFVFNAEKSNEVSTSISTT